MADAKTAQPVDKTTEKPVSAFSLFSKSYEVIKENANILGVLIGVPLILSILSALSTNVDTSTSANEISKVSVTGNLLPVGIIGSSILLIVLGVVVYAIVSLMAVVAELKAAKGEKLEWADLWEAVKKYGLRLIGLGIVTVILTVIGFILLIVPGVYAIGVLYLAPYHMIDKDLSIRDAIKASKEQHSQFTGAVWGLIGVSVMISFVSVIGKLGAILTAVLAAIYSVAPALRYVELKKLAGNK